LRHLFYIISLELQESTFEGSRAAAQKMKKYAKRQTKHDQKLLLFHGFRYLIRSNSEMLS
jgi:hypothetical protein